MLHSHSTVGIIATQFSNSASIQDNVTRLNEDSSALCSDKNILCIWYHDKGLSGDVQCEMKKRLNMSFTYNCIFNDICKFAAYLDGSLVVTRIFFIITSKFAECLCSIAANRPQHKKAYQYQPNSSLAKHSSVFTDINKLFTQISDDIQTCLNKNQSPSSGTSSTNGRESRLPPPWSVWNSRSTQNSFQYWRKESPEFFLFQALSRILINMKCDHCQSFTDMIGVCRQHYMDDSEERKKIDDVAKHYAAKDAILHYTKDSFLFRLVGRAFRSEDFENIFIFRPYIIDLHCEIDKLVRNPATIHNVSRLYRGKKLLTTIIQQLQDNIGALVSMNGFLSTTYKMEIAQEIFAGAGQDRPDYGSVIFEFCINETTMTRTYADISANSQFPSEGEVLFSIGSVWRIDSVQETNTLWWTVTLSSCNEVDLKIVQFFEELPNDSTLLMLGDVLLELGQHIKAENFYYIMLDEPTVDDGTRFTLYDKIAMINMEQGKYRAALENFAKAEALISATVINIEPSTLQPLYSHSTALSRIRILNNMGLLHQKISEPDKALEYMMKALTVGDEIEPIYKAKVCDNIGLIFYGQGQYGKAGEHFSKAIKLAQDHSSLPEYKQHYKAANEGLFSRNISLGKIK